MVTVVQVLKKYRIPVPVYMIFLNMCQGSFGNLNRRYLLEHMSIYRKIHPKFSFTIHVCGVCFHLGTLISHQKTCDLGNTQSSCLKEMV